MLLFSILQKHLLQRELHIYRRRITQITPITQNHVIVSVVSTS